jgi:hypothetical protein
MDLHRVSMTAMAALVMHAMHTLAPQNRYCHNRSDELGVAPQVPVSRARAWHAALREAI